LKPDIEVHLLSAVTENMISGHAIHPGDVLKASKGMDEAQSVKDYHHLDWKVVKRKQSKGFKVLPWH